MSVNREHKSHQGESTKTSAGVLMLIKISLLIVVCPTANNLYSIMLTLHDSYDVYFISIVE